MAFALSSIQYTHTVKSMYIRINNVFKRLESCSFHVWSCITTRSMPNVSMQPIQLQNRVHAKREYLHTLAPDDEDESVFNRFNLSSKNFSCSS